MSDQEKPKVAALKALMASAYADRPQSKARGEKIRTWKRIYLRELAKHGRNGLASRMAGVDPTTPLRGRRSSARFAAACKRACERARAARMEAVEAEIYRRAVDGTDEPIVSNGAIIGARKRFSDRLILRLAEADNRRRWAPSRKTSAGAAPEPLMPPGAAEAISDPAIAALAARLAHALTSRNGQGALPEPIDVEAEDHSPAPPTAAARSLIDRRG